jgi:hypothetical protein
MSKYNNDLRGVLFKNEDKKSDKHPDYKGNCEIQGVEYWLSAWIKTAESGRKYMSLSFEGKQKQDGQKPKKQEKPATGFDDMNDDIPW